MLIDKGCTGAPDWIIEIEKETMEEYSFDEKIPVGIYNEFFIKIQ